MRRIIKKIVTVVTTTTWKITLEPDEPVPENSSSPEALDPAIPDQFTSNQPLTNIDPNRIQVSEMDQADEGSAHQSVDES
jgi:hypothetical protein